MALLNTQYILPPEISTVPDTSGRFAFDPLNMSVKPDYSSLQMINDPTMQELLMQERQQQQQQQQPQQQQAPMSDRNQKLGLILYALGGALRGDKDFVQDTLALQQMQEGKKKQEAQKKKYDEFLERLDKDSPLYDFAKAMGYENVDKLALEMYKAETAVPEALTPTEQKGRILAKVQRGEPLTEEDQRILDILQRTDPRDVAIREALGELTITQLEPDQTQISQANTYPSLQAAKDAGLKSGDTFYGTDGVLYKIP